MSRAPVVRGCSAPPEWGRSFSFADLGAAIDRDGLAAYLALVHELADVARPVAPGAAAVLCSEAEPLVARERAFAVICCVLAQRGAQDEQVRRGRAEPGTRGQRPAAA